MPTLPPGISTATQAAPSPTHDSPTPSPTTSLGTGNITVGAASTQVPSSSTQPIAESETLADPSPASSNELSTVKKSTIDSDPTGSTSGINQDSTPTHEDPSSVSNQPDPTTTGVQVTTGSSNIVIGTIGSGSNVVTLVPDPSHSDEVIVTSNGGATTLKPGESGTINNQVFSLDSVGNVGLASSSTIMFGSNTVGPQRTQPDVIATIGTNIIVQQHAGHSVIVNGDQTLQLGQAITVSGQSGLVTVSANSAGSVALLSQGTATTLGQSAQSEYILGGQTLAAGGSAVSQDGVTYSMPSLGLGIVAVSDGTTTTFSASGNAPIAVASGVLATPVTMPQPIAITVNRHAISRVSDGIVIDGSTLLDGGSPTTISRAVYSLASNGDLIVGSGTTLSRQQGGFGTLLSAAVSAAVQHAADDQPLRQATFTEAGRTYTAVEPDGYNTAFIDGNTLQVGGSAEIVGGATLSLETTGIVIANDGNTDTLAFQTVSSSDGVATTIEAATATGAATTGINGGASGLSPTSSTTNTQSDAVDLHPHDILFALALSMVIGVELGYLS